MVNRLLAYWILRHPGVILACWTAFFIFFGSFSSQLPSVVKGPGLETYGSYAKVQQLMNERLGLPEDPVFVVFERQNSVTLSEFMSVIETTLKPIKELKGLESLHSPLDHKDLIHASAAYAVLGLAEPAGQQERIIRQIRSLLPEVSGVTIRLTGKSIVQADVNRASMQDFKTVERIGIPIAFIILFISFGGVTYAFIPILTGLLTVSAAMGIMAVIGRTYHLELSNFILNVIPMTGLALSLDFAFILTSRFREEISKGSRDAALRATMLTSGRAVFFSVVCVLCGLAAVAFIPMPMFESSALAAMIVVVLAAVINLSLVPALLVTAAPWLKPDRTRGMFISRSYSLWASWAGVVMQRPVRMLLTGGTLIALLLIPALRLTTSVPDAGSIPDTYESRQADETIRTHFQRSGTSETLLVLQPAGNDFSKKEREEAYIWLSRINKDPMVASVKPLQSGDTGSATDVQGKKGSLAVLKVTLKGEAGSVQVNRWLRETEQEANQTGLHLLLGGEAKSEQEIHDALASALPGMLAFIGATNFIVLFIAFRSILIPLKAMVMNMLSIAASFGVLVLVFQEGITGLSPGFIAIMIPVFIYGLVFGVSMDYGVFLLSRMSEAFEETGSPEMAIRRGMGATGKLISSAAAIMIAVTLPFAFGEVEGVKQLGVGIAAAVFIDATLIRLLLVPSLMKLLGHMNWWVPRWLHSS
ncbi:MMPL family transporter [Paenibacillus chibensis]|uniref:MMPL family transporter n=1 Tax=Paenibacillus chibensis TaxID=59846 RepID=A0ABU6PNB4_9BACL|nr:MMPL family transporter [Paenibacillus chibensis]